MFFFVYIRSFSFGHRHISVYRIPVPHWGAAGVIRRQGSLVEIGRWRHFLHSFSQDSKIQQDSFDAVLIQTFQIHTSQLIVFHERCICCVSNVVGFVGEWECQRCGRDCQCCFPWPLLRLRWYSYLAQIFSWLENAVSSLPVILLYPFIGISSFSFNEFDL